EETNAYDEMCKVLSAAVDQGGLEPHLAAALHQRVATWHRDRRADADAAEASLRKVVSNDPTRVGALRELITVQEERPDRNLFDSLERLADADPRDLDVLH